MYKVKYAHLHPPLTARVYAEEKINYPSEQEGVKAAKRALHQLYGAYIQDNANKKAAVLMNGINGPGDMEQLTAIMRLHTSTKERLPYLTQFYATVNEAITKAYRLTVTRILDIGCGYNPFSIPWMPRNWALDAYYAYDADLSAAALHNRFLQLLGLPPLAGCMDLAVATPLETVDIALLCKLLPVLETQSKGRGFQLINELDARYIVVTFPVKSLGGREKGMKEHYSQKFETEMEHTNNRLLLHKTVIGNELLYILENNNPTLRLT
jgi:16S rRNA (guanine(1405)-N(7))-methyltransferase